jgi:hypothetical protein
MQYGSSSAVTYVKMALDRSFSRSCSNRDGGDPDTTARPRPNRRAAAVNMGGMVAQMPTKAMASARAADNTVDSAAPSVPTNITVTTSNKGVEFKFPAFSTLYYDPIVASEESFEACSACAAIEPDDTSGGTSPSPPPADTSPTPSPPAATPAPAPASSAATVVPAAALVALLAAAM